VGILVLPEGPLKVAARPVLTSAGAGPVHSVLVFGRYINRKAVGDWADLAHQSLDMRLYNSPDLPADFRQVRAGLTLDSQEAAIQILGPDRIAAYALIADLTGNPGVILRVDAPRELHRQTLVGMGLTALSLAVVGLFFGGIAYLLIS
jgi:sensor domain CHASE-containing protein